MGAGIPVVANKEIGDQQRCISASDGGILVPYNSKKAAESIDLLLKKPQLISKMGKSGSNWVNNNRCYDLYAKQLEKKYIDIIN